jgi:hypothetical protein
MKTRAEMKKEYKDQPIPMGVFLVQNTLTHEFVIGASRNLQGSLNRYRSMLQMARPEDPFFKNPKMLQDFKGQGEDSFEFKVLDTLTPKEEPDWDPTDDLKALEALWLVELKGRGWTPY